MRIIAGKFRGRTFRASSKISARPTTNFAKEALFNILKSHLNWEHTKALDLFAGIGSISLEAVSHGCQNVTAIEQDRLCIRFIEETKNTLAIDSELQVWNTEVFSFLQKNRQSFDFIFADPPYDLPTEQYIRLVEMVLDEKHITTDGLFVLEHPQERSFEQHTHFLKHKKYGNVHFTFFKFAP